MLESETEAILMKMKSSIRRSCIMIAVIYLTGSLSLAANDAIITRAASLPETTPWDLVELSKAPQFEWSGGSKVRSLYYNGEPYKGKATRVFAYYATPGSLSGDSSKDKNLPAIVLVHGGTGTAVAEWAELWASRGYAAIAIDNNGYGPGKQKLTDGGPELAHSMIFGTIDLPISDQWVYHGVSNVIRAHSLIRSFTEVNADRTAITGISWGGFLTCVVTGLDNRFAASVPVYGCGFLAENSAWLHEFANMSADNVAKWTQLWDPSQYVGRTSVPMLFVNGGTDYFFRPDSHAKTYALVQSPKNLHYVPYLQHGHVFDRPNAIEVFMDHYLKGGIPLPLISEPQVNETQVIATVDTQTALVAAELHYSSEPLASDPNQRVWLKQTATLNGNQVIASIPPEETVVWFLTVEDERATTVSSQLVFPGE